MHPVDVELVDAGSLWLKLWGVLPANKKGSNIEEANQDGVPSEEGINLFLRLITRINTHSTFGNSDTC
jgi:hypothetical protein